MKIALISPSTKSLEEMRVMLASNSPLTEVICHEGGISRLRSVVDKERPHIVVLEGMYHDGSELAPVEFITTHYPQTMVIMLCPQHTSEFLINAMRAGVREVLPSPVSKTALDAAITRAQAKLGLRTAQRCGRVLAFESCKGGSGATFLATNLGYQLAIEGKKVLLIDLNLQLGEAVMTVHDRKPTSDIAEVARNVSRLDASLLSASVVQIAPNFEILAAPDDPAQSLQVKPEHLEAILNIAVNEYDFVIMDLGRTVDQLTIKALDRAHNIFLVMQTMLPHVRNANRMMTLFRSLGYPEEKVELLVNRFWKNGEIGLDDIRSSLGIAKLRTIPNGYREVAAAINQGVPLAQISKSSLVLKAISELAQSILPKSEQLQTGLFGRLIKR